MGSQEDQKEPHRARVLKTWGQGLRDADPMLQWVLVVLLVHAGATVQSIFFIVSIRKFSTCRPAGKYARARLILG